MDERTDRISISEKDWVTVQLAQDLERDSGIIKDWCLIETVTPGEGGL